MKKTINKLQFILALWISKTTRHIVKLVFKDRGTNIPGVIAIKLCSNFLKHFKLPSIVIAVTGANGKTSTSNYINQILIKSGYLTINNSEGSNMPTGIATSLIANASLTGNCRQDVAIFEADERASALIYKYITPTYLVCTNLFRDSIMRNGHSEFILNKMKSAIPTDTTLILNADDLISSSLGTEENLKVFYGVDKVDSDTTDCTSRVCDVSVCPNCKTKLQYEYVHYHHIGKAYCSNCYFKSPTANIYATNIDMKNHKFQIVTRDNNEKFDYTFDGDTLFNIYNIVAAITACSKVGVKHEVMKSIVEDLKIKSSRKDSEEVEGKTITTMLSKNQNPISCSRTMDYVVKLPQNKAIILIITDPNGDEKGSEDISWIYDTDLEYMMHEDIKQIIVCGKRAYDVVLALKIAGVKNDIIEKKIEYNGIQELVKYDEVQGIYILHSLYATEIALNLKKEIIKKVKKTND